MPSFCIYELNHFFNVILQKLIKQKNQSKAHPFAPYDLLAFHALSYYDVSVTKNLPVGAGERQPQREWDTCGEGG